MLLTIGEMMCDCVRIVCGFYFFFFKQKTAYEMRISDWSSDVCSSDLDVIIAFEAILRQDPAAAHDACSRAHRHAGDPWAQPRNPPPPAAPAAATGPAAAPRPITPAARHGHACG